MTDPVFSRVEDANTFICQSCEDEKGGVTVADHHATHTIVRCLEPPVDEESKEENKSTDERVASLEAQISALTSQMERIEKLLRQTLGGGSVVDGEA